MKPLFLPPSPVRPPSGLRFKLLSLLLVVFFLVAYGFILVTVSRSLAASRPAILSGIESDLVSRVRTRIVTDKLLADSNLEIVPEGEGKVILRGSVANRTLKTRALDLAQETAGVVSVLDEITTAN